MINKSNVIGAMRIMAIILLVTVAVFGFTACPTDGGDDNNNANNNNGDNNNGDNNNGDNNNGDNNNGDNGEPTHAHDWGLWIETKAPTFITEGEESRTCKDDPSHAETRIKALPITTGAEWTTALSQISEKGNTGEYTLTIGGNVGVVGIVEVDGSTDNSFGTTASGALSVTLKGNGKLSLTSNGNLLRIGARQTLIIDSDALALEGLDSNDQSLVYVGADGTLELKKGTISGNTTSGDGGGVCVDSGGNFTMHGGKISGNTANEWGGGVEMHEATFTMRGGEISGNTAKWGGGVDVYEATFTMRGGEISGNTADKAGGGVHVEGGTFRMVTGTIYGNENTVDASLRNTATEEGAALYVSEGSTATYGPDGTGTDLDTTNDTIKVKEGGVREL